MSPKRDRKHKTRVLGLVAFSLALALQLRGCWREEGTAGWVHQLLYGSSGGVSALN